MNDQSKSLKHNPDLDETSLRFMLKLAGPMVVTMTSFTLMQFVDRLMVSRLGTAALAAVLPAGYTVSIPYTLVMGVFASVGTFVSQCLGRGQKKECASYFWQAVYMGLAFSLVVLAIGWPLAPSIFRSYGHSPDVVELEVIYFRIILISGVAVIFVWAGTQFFMGIHRPVLSMYAALTAQVVNITANYVLIFGKFGFPKMGIAGAAWGTVIGVIVGAGIRMSTFLSGDIRKNYLSAEMFRPDFRKMADLLKVGLPAGLELSLSGGLWGAILFWLVGRFGIEEQAATSAALACTNLSIMPIEGIKTALTAAVGKSIGAGKERTAVKQTLVCLRIALIYMGLVGLCFLLFGKHLMRMWSTDDKVIQTGIGILVLAAVYQLFYASRTVYSGALRGAGDTLWLAAASGFGSIIVLGLGGFIIVKLAPGLGSTGPWIAATLSIIAVGLANRMRFKSNKWKNIKLFKRKPVEVQITEQ